MKVFNFCFALFITIQLLLSSIEQSYATPEQNPVHMRMARDWTGQRRGQGRGGYSRDGNRGDRGRGGYDGDGNRGDRGRGHGHGHGRGRDWNYGRGGYNGGGYRGGWNRGRNQWD